MLRFWVPFVLIFNFILLLDCQQSEDVMGRLRVMSFNIWFGGSKVEDGINKIAKHIQMVDPDIVLLQENYPGPFKQLLTALGGAWDGILGGVHWPAVITKHKFLDQDQSKMLMTNFASGRHIFIPGLNLTLYAIAVHLNYQQDGPQNFVNGDYSLEEKEHKIALGDVNPGGNGRLQQMHKILSHSQVEEAFHRAARQQEVDGGEAGERFALLLGGDFNEPSHLDWTERAKHLHDGYSYNWPVTLALADKKMVDSFRKLHPDEVEQRGITWSCVQKWQDPENTNDKEPQNRIDFIFYHPSPLLIPVASYTYQGNQPLTLQPDPLVAKNDYPSDHRALITEFAVVAKPISK